MNVEIGRQNIIILFEAMQFHFWEYINQNQTFISDSHQPFICSAEFREIEQELDWVEVLHVAKLSEKF
jgi:hypothetical protein